MVLGSVVTVFQVLKYRDSLLFRLLRVGFNPNGSLFNIVFLGLIELGDRLLWKVHLELVRAGLLTFCQSRVKIPAWLVNLHCLHKAEIGIGGGQGELCTLRRNRAMALEHWPGLLYHLIEG